METRDVEESDEERDGPVGVEGALGTEDFEGEAGQGRTFSGEVPDCLHSFVAKSAGGLGEGYLVFVVGVVPKVGKGRDELGEEGSNGSRLGEDEGAFSRIGGGKPKFGLTAVWSVIPLSLPRGGKEGVDGGFNVAEWERGSMEGGVNGDTGALFRKGVSKFVARVASVCFDPFECNLVETAD